MRTGVDRLSSVILQESKCGDSSASFPAARFNSCAVLNFTLRYDFRSIHRHFQVCRSDITKSCLNRLKVVGFS